jgi:hypothetical protein
MEATVVVHDPDGSVLRTDHRGRPLVTSNWKS